MKMFHDLFIAHGLNSTASIALFIWSGSQIFHFFTDKQQTLFRHFNWFHSCALYDPLDNHNSTKVRGPSYKFK